MIPNFPPEVRAKALCEWLWRERGIASDGLQDAIALTIGSAARAAENDAIDRAAEVVANAPEPLKSDLLRWAILGLKHPTS